MNYTLFAINNSTISSLYHYRYYNHTSYIIHSSLSFTTECNQIQWLTQQKKSIEPEVLKQSLPSNTLFNIASLVFNQEKNKQETAYNYKCIYDPSQNAFCLVIDAQMKYASLTKEVILNLLYLGKELNVEAIILLIQKENKDYVNIIKGMMIVGFAIEKRVNTTVIEDQTYKIMKMNIKCTGMIEEVDF